nr:hypothetical protein [Paenibacillus durus]
MCQLEQDVKRDGRNKPRKIRHLNLFSKKSYLYVPSLRLACSRCRVGFVWTYEFVGPKERYSRLFRLQTVEQALGSTAAHSARMQEAPASTVRRMHQEAISTESERLTKQAWNEAKDTTDLVLGITLPLKKDTRTIRAFTIFGEKPCWIYWLDASWKTCVPMLASTPTFLR